MNNNDTATYNHIEIPQGILALFGSETLVPAQFWNPNGGASLMPEREVCLAVLEEAFSVYRKHFLPTKAGVALGAKARKAGYDAEAWFASTDCDSPFAFEPICDVLGLNPDYIRRGLNALRAKAEARRDGTRNSSHRPARIVPLNIGQH